MPFDDRKYHASAEQGQVGGVALDVSIAFLALARAMQKIADATGVDISKEISDIVRMEESLDKRFDNLTGWRPEEK